MCGLFPNGMLEIGEHKRTLANRHNQNKESPVEKLSNSKLAIGILMSDMAKQGHRFSYTSSVRNDIWHRRLPHFRTAHALRDHNFDINSG